MTTRATIDFLFETPDGAGSHEYAMSNRHAKAYKKSKTSDGKKRHLAAMDKHGERGDKLERLSWRAVDRASK